MEYKVADSYKEWELIDSPYTKNGKVYSLAKHTCDRCHKGIYVSRVENGHIVPHPAYGGICLKCQGAGYLKKEIRLYTPAEYDRMKRANEKAKDKREQERIKKMQEGYAHEKEVWLETNGFNPEGITYVVTGETYSIKDQLKNAGFKYDNVLKWHRSYSEVYEDRCVPISTDEIIEFSAWGKGYYKEGAKEYIEKKIAGDQPESTSVWVGEIGTKYNAGLVTLSRKSHYNNRYGLSCIYTFVDQNDNELVWFTQKELPFEIGDQLYLEGTVKSHNEYKGVMSTVLTRCRTKGAE